MTSRGCKEEIKVVAFYYAEVIIVYTGNQLKNG